MPDFVPETPNEINPPFSKIKSDGSNYIKLDDSTANLVNGSPKTFSKGLINPNIESKISSKTSEITGNVRDFKSSHSTEDYERHATYFKNYENYKPFDNDDSKNSKFDLFGIKLPPPASKIVPRARETIISARSARNDYTSRLGSPSSPKSSALSQRDRENLRKTLDRKRLSVKASNEIPFAANVDSPGVGALIKLNDNVRNSDVIKSDSLNSLNIPMNQIPINKQTFSKNTSDSIQMRYDPSEPYPREIKPMDDLTAVEKKKYHMRTQDKIPSSDETEAPSIKHYGTNPKTNITVDYRSQYNYTKPNIDHLLNKYCKQTSKNVVKSEFKQLNTTPVQNPMKLSNILESPVHDHETVHHRSPKSFGVFSETKKIENPVLQRKTDNYSFVLTPTPKNNTNDFQHDDDKSNFRIKPFESRISRPTLMKAGDNIRKASPTFHMDAGDIIKEFARNPETSLFDSERKLIYNNSDDKKINQIKDMNERHLLEIEKTQIKRETHNPSQMSKITQNNSSHVELKRKDITELDNIVRENLYVGENVLRKFNKLTNSTQSKRSKPFSYWNIFIITALLLVLTALTALILDAFFESTMPYEESKAIFKSLKWDIVSKFEDFASWAQDSGWWPPIVVPN